MVVLGLDIGSRTVDAVWLEGDRVLHRAVADSGFEPHAVAAAFAQREDCERVVATGYGRHAAAETLGAEVVTEIKAYALGVAHLFPEARSVLDIGGQDTKVISLGEDGRVRDFEMNDKCAAGTGKFLEVMARALGFDLHELGPAALEADEGVKVSSMCTVFAESEVTGLLHRGESRKRIARGLHDAIATRTLGTLSRVGAVGPLVFAGGVANNLAMIAMLRDGFGGTLIVPEEAQTVGALGAALSAARRKA